MSIGHSFSQQRRCWQDTPCALIHQIYSDRLLAAFEILLEEIETQIASINKSGATAFESADYAQAREALDLADPVTTFRDKLVSLRKEWETLMAPHSTSEEGMLIAERRSLGRLQHGQRTPEQAYYQPILKALHEMGGAAKLGDVLDRVEQLMRSTLKKVDYEPLASDQKMPRWRNTAQWARYEMVKEGLLKQDSPRGIWEITEIGRKLLAEGTH